MNIYYNLDEERNVSALSTVSTIYTPQSAEYKGDFLKVTDLEGYFIESGELKYSEDLKISKRKAKEEAEAIKRAEENIEYLKNAEFLNNLDDDDALTVKVLYPKWEVGIRYKEGRRIRGLDSDKLYTVIQEHVSQAGWMPENCPALFAEILYDIDNPDEVSEWVQPDSTNPYAKGDMVIFEGKTYESLIDNNVWSPADYPAGWKEV